eukprot:scaffold125235_cov20-Tisochrysis_lutea.AAC.3
MGSEALGQQQVYQIMLCAMDNVALLLLFCAHESEAFAAAAAAVAPAAAVTRPWTGSGSTKSTCKALRSGTGQAHWPTVGRALVVHSLSVGQALVTQSSSTIWSGTGRTGIMHNLKYAVRPHSDRARPCSLWSGLGSHKARCRFRSDRARNDQ